MLTTTTLLAVTPVEETATVAPDTKFEPVRVTGTLVLRRPLAGAREVSTGGTAVIVKGMMPLEPEAVVTTTLRTPAGAFPVTLNVAVSSEELTTVISLTVTPDGDTVMVVAREQNSCP